MAQFSLNPFINRGVIMLADICAIFVAIDLVAHPPFRRVAQTAIEEFTRSGGHL